MYSVFHPPVRDPSTVMEVMVGMVITHVVSLDFDNSCITLNIGFVLSWKVIDIEYLGGH